jgi:argininosuccinate synthase
LYKGNCTVMGRKAPKSLYQEGMATYSDGDEFNHESAEGFVKIFGLGTRIANTHLRAEAEKMSNAKPDVRALT